MALGDIFDSSGGLLSSTSALYSSTGGLFIGGSGGGAFTPPSITGDQLWLDATDPTVFTLNYSASIYNVNGGLGQSYFTITGTPSLPLTNLKAGYQIYVNGANYVITSIGTVGMSPALYVTPNVQANLTGAPLFNAIVSQWNDKSGNNNHAYQSNAAYQPFYAPGGFNGGYGGVDFADSTNAGGVRWMNLTNNIVLGDYESFATANTDDSFGTVANFFFLSRTDVNNQLLTILSNEYLYADTNAGNAQSAETHSFTSPCIIGVGRQGTNFLPSFNGAVGATRTWVNTTITCNAICNIINIAYNPSIINQVVLYNNYLSAPNRALLTTFLKTKGGLS